MSEDTKPQAMPDNPGQLEFPCDITVKAMGNNTETFAAEIYDICKTHIPELQEGDMSVKTSSGGKFQSINIRMNAKSREQLEKLYQELNAHPDVHMTL